MASLAVLVTLAVLGASSAAEENRFSEVDKLPPAPRDLRYAFILFRHGIRSPLYDLYDDQGGSFKKLWPEGKGILTLEGKQLMAHVGQSLRTRYKGVIPLYNANNVQVTSTTVERAYLSAQQVFSGLFPTSDPTNRDILKKTPLDVKKKLFDKHFIFDEDATNSECPTQTSIRDEARQGEKALETWTQKLFFNVLTEELEQGNIPFKVNSLLDILKVCDNLVMEKHSRRLDRPWAGRYLAYMQKMVHKSFWRQIHSKTGMIQFYTGPMFSQILMEMEQAKSQEGGVKLHLHGSHDTTLCPVYWALSKDEKYFAKLGDTILIELSKANTIKMLLYSPLEEKPSRRLRVISLKRLCKQDPCPMAMFKEKLSPLTLTEQEWSSKCHQEIDAVKRKEPHVNVFLRASPLHLWARQMITKKLFKPNAPNLH